MAVTVKIGSDAIEQDQLGQQEAEKPQHEPRSIGLDMRQTLDGNVVVRDHPDIDIVINLSERNIVAFSTDKRSDKVYDVQDRFFNFLAENGIIDRSKIQGGSVYGSMEAKYPPQQPGEKHSNFQRILLVITKFIESESDYFNVDEEFEKEFERSLTDPDEDESTELGEVPHSDQKGSIRPGYIYSPYGISSIYRYE